MDASTAGTLAIFSRTARHSVNARSSFRVITTSAFDPRIFPFRSASNPDITDSTTIGAAVPRNTPKIEMAVNTVNEANSTPR